MNTHGCFECSTISLHQILDVIFATHNSFGNTKFQWQTNVKLKYWNSEFIFDGRERERERQWISTHSWILHATLTTSKRLISFYFGNNSMTWIIRMFDFDGAFVASTDKMMHLTALFCMWYIGCHKFHYILPLSFTCNSRCHRYYRQIYGYVVAQMTMYCRSLSKIHFHQMSLQRNVK